MRFIYVFDLQKNTNLSKFKSVKSIKIETKKFYLFEKKLVVIFEFRFGFLFWITK
jgi:hypothetical protein